MRSAGRGTHEYCDFTYFQGREPGVYSDPDATLAKRVDWQVSEDYTSSDH